MYVCFTEIDLTIKVGSTGACRLCKKLIDFCLILKLDSWTCLANVVCYFPPTAIPQHKLLKFIDHRPASVYKSLAHRYGEYLSVISCPCRQV